VAGGAPWVEATAEENSPVEGRAFGLAGEACAALEAAGKAGGVALAGNGRWGVSRGSGAGGGVGRGPEFGKRVGGVARSGWEGM
jgi:hypothetical protein